MAVARSALLLATLTAFAAPARAATVLIPEFQDDDGSEALRVRSAVLRAVGATPGLAIAPLSKFKKLARSARLDPHALGTPEAARRLAKLAHLDGILSGAVDEAGGRRTLHVQFFDATGSLAFQRDLDLASGDLRQDQGERVAHGLSSALNLDDAPADSPAGGPARRKPAAAAGDDVDASTSLDQMGTHPKRRPPDDGGDDRSAHKREPPPSDDLGAEGNDRPAPSGDDLERLKRYEDPGFEIALGVQLSDLTSQVVNNLAAMPGVNPCAGATLGQGCFSSLSSSLYPGFAATISTFPFHVRLDALAGLGLIAHFNYGPISVSTASQPAGFQATDLRLGANLVYRLRLPIFDGEGAIFSPSLGLRGGLGIWQFSTPTNSANLYSLNRLVPNIGGEVLEPFGHYLRLSLGGDYLPSPTPGDTLRTQLMATSVLSSGFDLTAELQAHFAPPNTSGLTGALRFAYTSLQDCFETPAIAVNACTQSGTQSYLDVALFLGYGFY